MKSQPVTPEELRRTHLFAGLEPAQLERVIGSARVIKLDDGACLFQSRQHAEHFFLLRSGSIKLSLYSPDGNEKVIHLIAPRETFGEAVMFMDGQSYPVDATALGDSEIVSFKSSVFRQILQESTDTCFRLLADMSAWLKKQLGEIDALTLQNATLRFINFLLQQARDLNQNTLEVHLPAAKNIVASRLSIKPESLSRILRHLQQTGYISVQGQQILIHDVPALRKFSAEGGALPPH